jgi:type II secretory pathway pseudopilin PulG
MTLAEMAVVLGIAGTVSAIALPLLSGLDDARVAGAARYMSSRLAEARLDAIAQSREVALRFTPADGTYSFSIYVDGNRNGVLARDIARGVDRRTAGPEKISDNFRNVDFGVQPGVPPIDSGSSPSGDPIKLGVSNSVSFSPLGTSTTGTIYLTSRSGAQYAVRMLGTTGRIRIYRFMKGDGKWLPVSAGPG